MASRNERRTEAAARGAAWRIALVLARDYFRRHWWVFLLVLVQVSAVLFVGSIAIKSTIPDKVGLAASLAMTVLASATLQEDLRKGGAHAYLSLPMGAGGAARAMWGLSLLSPCLLATAVSVIAVLYTWFHGGDAGPVWQMALVMVVSSVGWGGLMATGLVNASKELRERLVRSRWDSVLRRVKLLSVLAFGLLVLTSDEGILAFPNVLILAACPLYAAQSYVQYVRWARTPYVAPPDVKVKPVAAEHSGQPREMDLVSARIELVRRWGLKTAVFSFFVTVVVVEFCVFEAFTGKTMGWQFNGPLLCIMLIFLPGSWRPSVRTLRMLPISSNRLTLLLMEDVLPACAGLAVVWAVMWAIYPQAGHHCASVARFFMVGLGIHFIVWRVYAHRFVYSIIGLCVIGTVCQVGRGMGLPCFTNTPAALVTAPVLMAIGFFVTRQEVRLGGGFYTGNKPALGDLFAGFRPSGAMEGRKLNGFR